jgi:[ribosomal protein S5]-alanine N-acetyltransferase
VNGNREYFLRSERLGFGYWTDDDTALAEMLWGDPRVSSLIGGPFGLDEVGVRLRREMEMRISRGVQYWPVFFLPDGEFVGCAGLRPYGGDEGVFEMGVHLRPEYWGLGLGREAGRAVISFALETLGVQGIFAGHHPKNEASEQLLKKLGFRFTHEEFYPPTGLKHPSYFLKKLD